MNLSRRTLLAAAAAMIGERAIAFTKRVWPLGVQLWSVDAEMRRDVPGTLARIAALGYQSVETAGLHGLTPQAFGRAVRSAGLSLDSAHASLPDLHADRAGRIGAARDSGAGWLVCSSPMPSRPLAPGREWNAALTEAMTRDDWRRNADLLNEIAAAATRAGLRFAYHNHVAEFARKDGRRGIDILLADTDPALVRFELDIAWAAAGGANPAGLIRAHPGRIALLHLKDLRTLPPAGKLATDLTTAEVSLGAIRWPDVIAAARAAGVAAAFVEQEAPYRRPVFESLAISRDQLRRLGAVAPQG